MGFILGFPNNQGGHKMGWHRISKGPETIKDAWEQNGLVMHVEYPNAPFEEVFDSFFRYYAHLNLKKTPSLFKRIRIELKTNWKLFLYNRREKK